MLQRISLPLLKEGSCFPPFRKRLLAISLRLRLQRVSYRKAKGIRGRLTLMVPGDGGLTSNVANAGALVSPLSSPPSPLERLRILGVVLPFEPPPRGVNLSVEVRTGKASVVAIFADTRY